LNNCHSIVLDHGGLVIQEYEPYLDEDRWLQDWFKSMNSKGKVVSRPSHRIALNVYVTDDDKKFVGLAANTLDGIIVSEDSDFTEKKTHIDFISRRIRILTMQEICGIL